MAIELEKILTISAKDYCEMHDKSLRDYTCVGVHVEEFCDERTEEHGKNLFYKNALYIVVKGVEYFRKAVPEDAEVVVDFKPSIGSETKMEDCAYIYAASGTALIPKKK